MTEPYLSANVVKFMIQEASVDRAPIRPHDGYKDAITAMVLVLKTIFSNDRSFKRRNPTSSHAGIDVDQNLLLLISFVK